MGCDILGRSALHLPASPGGSVWRQKRPSTQQGSKGALCLPMLTKGLLVVSTKAESRKQAKNKTDPKLRGEGNGKLLLYLTANKGAHQA